MSENKEDKKDKTNKTTNSDLLTDLENLFPQALLTPQQEDQYEIYLNAIEIVDFSTQQKVIWELFALKGYTVTRMARHLGLNKSTVSRTLQSAIDKLKVICERERAKKFSNHRNLAGFQTRIEVKGQTEIEPLIQERLDQHKEEIEGFYKEHPELKEGRKEGKKKAGKRGRNEGK